MSDGHTAADTAALISAGVDPAVTQPREHAVRCVIRIRETWHQMGCCDRHYTPPAACRRGVAR